MTKEEIAAMQGGNAYKGGHVGGSYHDTITLGKDGKFYLSHYSQPKDERADPDCLGDSFDMTIVKIRGKLIRWENSQKTIESIEYDAGLKVIPTTAGDISEKDAKALGAKKTIVIYALVNGNVVKLSVSGGSLYNPEDETDLRLYPYLQSFEGDDHSFMVKTVVKAKENKYVDDNEEEHLSYQMTFAKGAETTDAELAVVGTSLKQLVEDLVGNDARDLKFLGSEPKGTAPAAAATTADDDF